MFSKDIKFLLPATRKLYEQWTGLMASAGLSFALTRVGCSLDVQMAIYVKGRLPLVDVNRFRTATGLYLLSEAENKTVVTWTLQSQHIIDDKGFCNAWDFVLLKDGKANWDVKMDINQNNVSDYIEAGKLAESIGLISGRTFKTPDYCHIQGI